MTSLSADDKARLYRRLFAVLGAFSAVTLCWISLALLGGGDFFAQAKVAAPIVLLLAAIGGFLLGLATHGKLRRIVLMAASAGSLVFWLFAPDGWWALPPPKRSEVRIE